MAFQESVIIPYTLFKQCQLDKPQSSEEEKLLRDTTIPSDLKMKLYAHKKASVPKNTPVEEEPQSDVQFIVDLMPIKDQPFVGSILEKIKSRSNELHWNNNLEVTIDKKFFPDSNIIELLRFCMKNKVVTSHIDIPIAAHEFIDKLLEIGVPKPWIKVSFRRRPPKRTTKRRAPDYASDSDTATIEGFGWTTY